MELFLFFKEKSILNIMGSTTSVLIPKGIHQKNELFHLFSSSLKFPLYFGNNWDGLYDCLTDLSWISENQITIIHENIPCSNKEEKKKYLELMADVALSWQGDANHHLNIWFPEIFKREIHEILNGKKEERFA